MVVRVHAAALLREDALIVDRRRRRGGGRSRGLGEEAKIQWQPDGVTDWYILTTIPKG